jgi:hypothetical protein
MHLRRAQPCTSAAHSHAPPPRTAVPPPPCSRLTQRCRLARIPSRAGLASLASHPWRTFSHTSPSCRRKAFQTQLTRCCVRSPPQHDAPRRARAVRTAICPSCPCVHLRPRPCPYQRLRSTRTHALASSRSIQHRSMRGPQYAMLVHLAMMLSTVHGWVLPSDDKAHDASLSSHESAITGGVDGARDRRQLAYYCDFSWSARPVLARVLPPFLRNAAPFVSAAEHTRKIVAAIALVVATFFYSSAVVAMRPVAAMALQPTEQGIALATAAATPAVRTAPLGRTVPQARQSWPTRRGRAATLLTALALAPCRRTRTRTPQAFAPHRPHHTATNGACVRTRRNGDARLHY